MTIIQALVYGGGRSSDEIYETIETEFGPIGTKPLVTIIPDTPNSEQTFPPITGGGIQPTINDVTLDGTLLIEMWGGGGASGSCREGQSGNGGPGGYTAIRVPTRSLGLYNRFLKIKVGGGGGNPDSFNIPSDEYDTQNIATITPIASAAAVSSVTLGNVAYTTQSTVGSTRTPGATPTQVSTGTASNSTAIPLTSVLAVNDVIFVAASCDDGSFPSLAGFTDLLFRAAPVDNTPGTLNGPSYRLMYKVIAAGDPLLTTPSISLGLTPPVSNTAKIVSYVATAFRNVDPTFGIYPFGENILNRSTNTNTTSLPDFISDVPGCTLASFGFLDDRTTTVTPPPVYVAGPIASSNNSPAGPIARKTGITINGVAGDTFVQDQDASGTPVTFDIGGLSAGDFVLVAAVSDGQFPNTFGPGFTEFTSPLFSQPNVRYGYTFAAGTTVTVENSDNASGGNDNIAYSVLVFTGVDDECPLDVNPVENDDGGGGGFPNPPNITPITDGCMLVALGFLDDDVVDPADVSAPAGFILGPISATDQGGGDSSSVSTAYRLLTAGANTAQGVGSFFSADGNDDDSWLSYTLALRPKRIDSSVFAAYRQLATSQSNLTTGGSFTTSVTGCNVGATVLLRPTETITASPSTLTYPTGTVTGDLIICSSISDGGTMSVPTGFIPIEVSNTNPSFQLSYKYYDAATDGTTINGLTTAGIIDNNVLTPYGPNLNGRPAGVRHIAQRYTGVSVNSPILQSLLDTGFGNIPDPVSFGTPNSSNYASIPFVFIGNRSLNSALITPPTGYSLIPSNAVGNDRFGSNEATIVNAIRNLTTETPDDPAVFALSNVSPFKTITIGLQPTATPSGFTGNLTIPAYTSVFADLIISTSIVDNGQPSVPTGFTTISQQVGNNANPGYQLSYKFTTGGVPDATVNNLTTNIGDRGTAHFVQVFRGVERIPIDPAAVISFTNDSGNGNTISFAGINTYRDDDTVVTVSFVDDKSVTVTNSPVDYTTPIVTSVGTNSDSTEEGTIIFSYNQSPAPGGTVETPGDIEISNGDNWDSFTIKLSPSIRNKFNGGPNNAYGGSSGGYTAIYDGLTNVLLAVVGGGGGGGAGTFQNSPNIFLPGSRQWNSPLSRGGDGGGGGGANQSGRDGGDGNSYVITSPSTSSAIAGIGGGGGSTTLGGIGGQAYSLNYAIVPPTRTNITILNPGENGVGIAITTSGSRGANSPYNVAIIPLQGANATGGFINGRGGGATRNDSTISFAAAARDCGGAGGAGYFSGGGGGVGNFGGGGGGGGGSGYAIPGIIVIKASSGIGTVPGGIDSPFFGGRVGSGANSVSGNTIPGGPNGPFVQGLPGGNGRVVITYIGFA